jgi:amino acid transporter
VPLNAMLVNLALGGALLLFVPFDLTIALASSAMILSLGIGPVMLISLRRQMADTARKFTLPFAPVLCAVAFVFATLAVMWAGWDTMKLLLLTIAIGIVAFVVGHVRSSAARPEYRHAIWLIPYIAGLAILTWLGTYGGGRGVIPFGWDLLLCGLLGLGSFVWATRSGLAQNQFDARLAGLEDLAAASRDDGSPI